MSVRSIRKNESGLFSAISGSVCVSQDSVLLYRSYSPHRTIPTRLLSSIVSCSDDNSEMSRIATLLDAGYSARMASDPTRTDAVREFVHRLRRALPSNIVDLRLFGSEARGD